MRVALLALACAACAACGDKFVYRPLTIDVQGISRNAQVLVLEAFPTKTLSCAMISIGNVHSFTAPYVQRWMRAEGGKRELDLPSVDDDQVSLVVYTENDTGRAIQFACSDVTYSEIEEGRIALRLSEATAGIIDPWRRSSAPSSSSGSSVAAGWRRSSSRAGRAQPIPSRSS